VSPDGPAPLVGRTTLIPADGVALMKAAAARYGSFTYPRLLMDTTIFGIIAAIAGVLRYTLMAGILLGLAGLLFALSIVAGIRTTRVISQGFCHGQDGEVSLDDDGVTVREPGMTLSYSWSRFDRAVDTGDHIALSGPAGVVLVLKRAFDAATYARARELIDAKVAAQRRP
jgi:hypothetical protein